MLDSVHERLEKLSEVVASEKFPTDKIQSIVKDEIQGLRTEVLRYEEAVAETGNMSEINITLRSKIESQQRLHQVLDGQVKALQQNEVDTKAHSAQLESELEKLRNTARKYETGSVELESQMGDMRQQLRKAGDELEAANGKIEQKERLQEQLEAEVAKYKVCSSINQTSHALTKDRTGMKLVKKNFSKWTARLRGRRR